LQQLEIDGHIRYHDRLSEGYLVDTYSTVGSSLTESLQRLDSNLPLHADEAIKKYKMSLTAAQTRDIIVTERVASVFSLTASAFVVVTFLLNDKFRKHVNRLVFYATFGNVITNIATLISRDGIEAGNGSPLCQFQAFLIQWLVSQLQQSTTN